MNFLEELKWRHMLNDMTPGVEEIFKQDSVVGYIGFDPTAPSLTIGNLVQVMILTHFQRTGNNPVVLMGGATGLIGDPSFKDEERQLKSNEEVEDNIAKQMRQFEKLLDFEGAHAARFVNNYDFYKDMNVLAFLRDVGKTLTVNYMASKESVKKRMETGISFTEFSYQLLQGYDFQVLYDKFGCRIQMGGSDQWGNITSGTEFIRRNVGGKAYAVTTPLLTKSDGTKFGKSEQGNIWLDPEMTNPFKFYQFWINCNDADLEKLLLYFSLKSHADIEELIQMIPASPNQVKQVLAEELTARIHDEGSVAAAKRVSQLLFDKGFNHDALNELDQDALDLMKDEIGHKSIPTSVFSEGKPILDWLTEDLGVFASKGEAKRAIQGNAVQINRQKVTDLSAILTVDYLVKGQFALVENGKSSKLIVDTF